MISFILVEPKKSGNLGAAARVMANFGFDNLVLVNPKCKKTSKEAIKRAKHGVSVLKKAKVVRKIPKMDTLIATTAMLGTDYNIPRSPVSPEQLSKIIPKKGRMGIVFGREGPGLTNEEVLACDFVCTIPSSRKYPTLNLSHSVAVVCYELSKQLSGKKVSEHIVFASKAEKDQLMKLLNQALKKMSFKTAQKKETQIKVWKRMIGKSFLTKREAYALMGFLKKLN
ncbi:TrmJ/YjtD family RNA methyltransferase [Candidatus Woesearchaeota archaeon]|nr:TrmJ/YjtD family RNA methyltransferase [Candidatus Woesearchaeota archaeon]